MSLFGQNTSNVPASSSNPFPSLSITPQIDPNGKRKSIFEPPSSKPSLFGAAGTATTTAAPSLFGGTTTATSGAGPSLFNKPATTAATPFSFGNAAATAAGPSAPKTPTASPFSFGNASATSNSNPAGALFGNTSSTAAPSTNPFGGLGGTGTATQQPVASSSLLGAPAAQSNPMQSNTQSIGFSAQQPEAVQQVNRDPAYFSSLLERQKKKARFMPTEQNGRLSQLPSLNMDLGDLARRAQEIGGRNVKPQSNVSDSRAHYLLAGSGVSPGKAYRDFQALDSKDVLPETRPSLRETSRIPFDAIDEGSEYLKDLQLKGRETMMKESMERVYREVDSFIEQSLGIDFEEQKLKIMEHFGLVSRGEDDLDESNTTSSRQSAFGNASQKRKSTLGGSSRSVFGRSAIEKSMIGVPGSTLGTTSFFKGESTASGTTSLLRGQTTRDLRDKERYFMEKVQDLNQSRLREAAYPIMKEFGMVEEKAAGESPRQLVDAYQALREITHEGSKVSERHYASSYLDDSRNSSKALQLRKQILDGSRSYLEKAFYRELESIIEKNPKEAQLGGRPTVINKVRAYIRVRAARRDLAPDGAELQQIGDNGDYCWILIFYLLRSGFIKEASDYVNNDTAFQSTDRRFVSYLTTYANNPERRLSRKLQEMIDGEYQQRSKLSPKNSVDPYRMACYKIIGRCDLSSRNLEAVGQGVEDWIWLQFSLARELDRLEELSGEVFALEQICETITEIGQKHFQRGQTEGSNAYGTFFLMQILAGMFEQAVDYLHTFNPVSAVHFAISLAYYGLLKVSDFNVAGQELLTYSTTQQATLNFVPLLAYYTTSFRTALPVAAVEYLTLICVNSDLTPASLGAVQINACHECLRELCLETREFAQLLGDIRTDGSRISGAIEQRARLIKLVTHEEFLKSITSQSAAVADQRGQVSDAVLLYHLCEDYDNVVRVLNRSLANAATLDFGESPMELQPLKPRQRDDKREGSQSSLSLTQSTSSPVELAKNMISLYNSNAVYYNLISPVNRDTCGALLRLLSARSHLEANPPQFMAALEELNDLNILPLRADGSIPTIRAAASAFGELPQILARCSGISIVWAVRAIGGERENIIRHGSWETGHGNDREAIKEQLSSMAKDLMVFAGMVKYKLPGRVYDMLTRAGADVGGY